MVENLFEKNPLQDLLSHLNAVILINESTEFITSHVIYKLAFTYKFQLKTTLALIHVMIQSPYVTKIKRDVAMTFTSYVANTGGLLGLCLGFSFISLVEILFWVCCCLRQVKG